MSESLSSHRLGAMLVLSALCLSAVALAAGAPAGADSHVAIEEAGVEQARGDVATFTLSVPQGESVAVVVDGPGGSRELNLSDASGDGRIALAINSYLAGPDATATEVYGVGDGDRLSVESEATGRLPAGSYRVEAYANGTDGDPADTAGLTLTEPGLGNATVMAAPNGSRERLDSLAAIQRAQEQRWLTPTNEVAVDDTVVLRLTVPGVAGAVANESGATDEARFRRLLAGPNASVLLDEREVGPMSLPRNISLGASNATTVVADPGNDTYYVAADLTADRFHEPAYLPRFVVDGNHRLNPDDIAETDQTGRFRTVEPDAIVTFPTGSGETVPVAPGPNRSLAGWTTVAPGTELTVVLSDGEGDPFPVTETVRVTQERPPDTERAVYRFRAAFDFSGAAPDTAFGIAIRANGARLGPEYRWDDEYEGYVDPVPAPANAATATQTAAATASSTATGSPTATASPSPTSSPAAPPTDGSEATPTRAVTESPTAETTAGDGHGFGAVAALLGLLALVALGGRPGRRDR